MLGEPGDLPNLPAVLWVTAAFRSNHPPGEAHPAMPYKFALERPDYSDLAGGKVLLGRPGHPALPVRLASEVFQRCLAIRAADGLTGPVTLCDPCCGAAYHLAVLAFLHGESLRGIVASDIDPGILSLAAKNLGMCASAGLDQRTAELAELHGRFGKPSHMEALAAAGRLRKRLVDLTARHAIGIRSFQADALDKDSLSRGLEGASVDVVIGDVPYGRQSRWQGSGAENPDPLGLLLESLHANLHPGSVVAVISDKGQKTSHAGYDRLERLSIGKRLTVFWRWREAPPAG
jgi:hypothetical protein